MTSHDDLEIPKFLRRAPEKKGKRRPAAPAPAATLIPVVAPEPERKVESVWLTRLVRLAETPFEESGFHFDRGVLPRRWYDGNEDGEVVMKCHAEAEARETRSEKKEEKETRQEARASRVHWKTGRRSLEEIILIMRPTPDIGHARRAIRSSGIEHVRYWILIESIEAARQAIREYAPGVKKSRARDELDRSAVITFFGRNPKKEGTGARERWAKLMSFSKRTVGEFLADGGNPTTLANAIKTESVVLKSSRPAHEIATEAVVETERNKPTMKEAKKMLPKKPRRKK